jgi:hypothetical protein
MAPETDRLSESLKSTHQLESFFHDFISHVQRHHPKSGEDVTKYVREVHTAVPDVIKGVPITWAPAEEHDAARDEGAQQTLVFVRPGAADALGFTIGCVRVGRVKVCLECGWLYCRIVIKGRW